jgi:glycosyltransferase involved in cell wall biosynthesis
MRVLFITERVSTHDLRFIQALAQHDHEVFLAPLVSDPAPSLTGSVHYIPLDGSPEQKSATLARIPSVDVVHAGPLNTAAALAAAAKLAPLVAVSWAYDVLTAIPGSPNVRDMKFALRHASAVIVDARCVEAAVRSLDYGGWIVDVPWGVDLDRFHPRTRRPTDRTDVTVISTRSWERMYRVPELITAFAFAREIDPRLRLTLLNTGSEAPEVMRAIARWDLAEVVDLRGYMSEASLARELRRADIYASASMVDGSSVSLLQALATGLPTVATDIPGNREWLRDEVGSALKKPADLRGFAQEIAVAASLSSSERLQVSRSARGIVEKRADWRLNSEALVRVYERVAAA